MLEPVVGPSENCASFVDCVNRFERISEFFGESSLSVIH
jgi:hypothetical protein